MIKFLEKLQLEFKWNKNSFINSIKTTLACLIGFALTEILTLQQPQWMIITIVIVMAAQYRWGSAMIKGSARLLATGVGAVLGFTILLFFPHNVIIIYTFFFIFMTLLSYLASNSKENSYAYTVGTVTMTIVIITSGDPNLLKGLERIYEVMLGVVIALLVSRFVFPIRSEKILYKDVSSAIRLLKEAYKRFIKEDNTFSLHFTAKDLEEEIINKFASQPMLLREACSESNAVASNQKKFIILLRLERRLLRSIYMLHYTLRVSLKSFSTIINMEEFKILHWKIINLLEDIAKKMEDKKYPVPEYDLQVTDETIITKIRSVLTDYDFKEKNKIHAFIFCMDHMVIILKRMKRLVTEISQID